MPSPAPSSHATNEAFALEGVSVVFGEVRALTDVSLAIGRGERVALVGPSGSGKTTMLRLFNAALVPTDGEVRSFGEPLAALRGRQLRRLRSAIALVPQNLSLVPNIRVVQNVISGRFGRRSLAGALRDFLLPSRSDTVSIYRTLDRVGIGEKIYQRTDTLSGGQQQRVAIARALFQEPDAILADEPVSSVDPARARDTVELLTRIAREEGVTLCMSLHNLDLAREFFPRLVGLKRGQVLFDAAPDSIDQRAVEELYHLERSELLEDGPGLH